jgi:hypothetical protein
MECGDSAIQFRRSILNVIAGLDASRSAATDRGGRSRVAVSGKRPATLDARIKSGHDNVKDAS